jgi:hypothetical protein
VNDIRPVGAKLEELTKAGADPKLIGATRAELIKLVTTEVQATPAPEPIAQAPKLSEIITVNTDEYRIISTLPRCKQQDPKQISRDIDEKISIYLGSIPVMSFLLDSLFKGCEHNNAYVTEIDAQIKRHDLLNLSQLSNESNIDPSALVFIQALGWQAKVALLEYKQNPSASDIIGLSKAIGGYQNTSGHTLAPFLIEVAKDEIALLSENKRRQLIELIDDHLIKKPTDIKKLAALNKLLKNSDEIEQRRVRAASTDTLRSDSCSLPFDSEVFKRRVPLVTLDFRDVMSQHSHERVISANSRAPEIVKGSRTEQIDLDPKSFLLTRGATTLVKDELSVLRTNNPKAAFTASAVILAAYTGRKATRMYNDLPKWQETSTTQNLIAEAIRNLVTLAGEHDLSVKELKAIINNTPDIGARFIRSTVQSAFKDLSPGQQQHLMGMLDLPYGLTHKQQDHLFELFP